MMGTYGLATTAAPIIAPTIAGLMIDAFGWKSIFYLVLVIMVISFIISSIVFEDVLELQNKKFDFLCRKYHRFWRNHPRHWQYQRLWADQRRSRHSAPTRCCGLRIFRGSSMQVGKTFS